jgi:sporulation protein YlmC with PRC-barrel domain
MSAVLKKLLFLSTSLLLVVYANNAISQVEQEATITSPPSSPEQGQGDVQGERSTVSVPPQSSLTALATPPENSPIPPQHTLLSGKTLVGVAVNNAQGEKIGTIREMMIDPRSGQVVYAVVDSVGSFGLGKQKSFAVPWKGLQVNLDQTEIVVQLGQGQFPMLPSVALDKR